MGADVEAPADKHERGTTQARPVPPESVHGDGWRAYAEKHCIGLFRAMPSLMTN